MSASSDDKFTLTGGDAEFGSRAQNIFAGLESLEARHMAVESSESVIRESYALMKPDPTDEFLAGPSNPADFRVPSRPPPKRIHSSPRPGYEKDPSKWKRYDLSDVSDSQLTEQSNQRAAKEFLDRFRIQPDEPIETYSATDLKHVFRKPDKKPESAKKPVSITDHGVEDGDDVDEAEDAIRTQILSFAEDEPLGGGSEARGSRTQFRRRRVKQTGDKEVRSRTSRSDDDDDDEEENVADELKTEGKAADAAAVRGAVSTVCKTSDTESDSDNFDELEDAQSGSDQEDEGPSGSDSQRYHRDDHSASDVDKYAPEDVDLESID